MVKPEKFDHLHLFNKPLLMVEIVVNWFEYVSVIFNLFGIKVLILSLPKVNHTIIRDCCEKRL